MERSTRSSRGRGRQPAVRGRRAGRTATASAESTVSRPSPSTSPTSTSRRWAMDNPNNWDLATLVRKLEQINITVPANTSKSFLLKLYKSNVNSNQDGDSIMANRRHPPSVHSPSSSTETHMSSGGAGIQSFNDIARDIAASTRPRTSMPVDFAIPQPSSIDTSRQPTSEAIFSLPASTSAYNYSGISRQSPANDATSVSGVNRPSQNTDNMESIRGEIAELRQQLMTRSTCSTISTSATAGYTGPSLRAESVAPDSLPYTDPVSASMRKNIVEGKLVNLAALLNAHAEAPGCRTTEFDGHVYRIKDDPSLNKSLTFKEFMHTFGIYRNVLCKAYPHRRAEMDAYERNITEMAMQYGTLFYEYHKLFASKAASWIEKGVRVNWGLIDTKLYCLVTSGHKSRSCNVCLSLTHISDMCPSLRACSGVPSSVPIPTPTHTSPCPCYSHQCRRRGLNV